MSSNPSSAPELEPITQAAEGLLFPSETDVAFTPFFWEDAAPVAPTADLVAAKTGKPVGDITSKSLKSLFAPLVKEEDWHNDQEKEEVRRFKALLEALNSNLKQVKAFRAGKVEIEITIIGVVSGGYAGLQTKAVET